MCFEMIDKLKKYFSSLKSDLFSTSMHLAGPFKTFWVLKKALANTNISGMSFSKNIYGNIHCYGLSFFGQLPCHQSEAIITRT